MELGKIIHEKRKELGFTQKEVGDYCGVAEATVSRWESGAIGNMRRDRIQKLATMLQLSPAEIMGFTERDLRNYEVGDILAMASQSPDVITLLEEYQKMTPGDRKRVVDFACALNLTASQSQES